VDHFCRHHSTLSNVTRPCHYFAGRAATVCGNFVAQRPLRSLARRFPFSEPTVFCDSRSFYHFVVGLRVEGKKIGKQNANME